mmetsp:Transcript_10063/g.24777  ORF Transcript_10063/g.24777 Transcript_10063/m.24777 type:complete len:91 (+) Transcript_10063:57-329(+)
MCTQLSHVSIFVYRQLRLCLTQIPNYKPCEFRLADGVPDFTDFELPIEGFRKLYITATMKGINDVLAEPWEVEIIRPSCGNHVNPIVWKE